MNLPFFQGLNRSHPPPFRTFVCTLFYIVCEIVKRGGFLRCSHFIIMKLVNKGLTLTVCTHTQCIWEWSFSPGLATWTKSSYYTHFWGRAGGVLRLRFFLKTSLLFATGKHLPVNCYSVIIYYLSHAQHLLGPSYSHHGAVVTIVSAIRSLLERLFTQTLHVLPHKIKIGWLGLFVKSLTISHSRAREDTAEAFSSHYGQMEGRALSPCDVWKGEEPFIKGKLGHGWSKIIV